MRLIIAGSRTVAPAPAAIDAAFDDFLFVLGDVSEVISGGARGADAAGEAWAAARGIAVRRDPVSEMDYERFGKYLAPKMRNRRMAERADAALVFWDGTSGGSADMVTRMVARGKPVRVIPTARSPRKR